jgi:acyl transferase domain-containing protein
LQIKHHFVIITRVFINKKRIIVAKNNILSSVKFKQQINSLPSEEEVVFLEISPNEGLLGQIKRTRGCNTTLIPTLNKKTLHRHSYDLNKMFDHLQKIFTVKNMEMISK